ncbi:QsdR family transcriptional regulator [Pseudonocardia sp. GCM10023141]|uniref:QsdR family transcriptional regulator n=1 Tax=Pseudonocardia sp. GCM10023141 TaxID=3252653 RepID=UPI003609EC73
MSPTADDVVRAATRHYLAGTAIDMSSLAAELGLGRATLYRRVGNREQLISRVLAERTAHTFGEVDRRVGGAGLPRILAVLEQFMNAVIAARPLRTLTARDPLLFIGVVMAPGPVEACATDLITGLLDEQVRAGALTLRIASDVLAQAVVRIADSYMYSHLLGGREPELHKALAVITLMLESAQER